MSCIAETFVFGKPHNLNEMFENVFLYVSTVTLSCTKVARFLRYQKTKKGRLRVLSMEKVECGIGGIVGVQCVIYLFRVGFKPQNILASEIFWLDKIQCPVRYLLKKKSHKKNLLNSREDTVRLSSKTPELGGRGRTRDHYEPKLTKLTKIYEILVLVFICT